MTITELIDFLNYHTKLYDEGHPAISDKEWDDAYFELFNLENHTGHYLPNSPTQRINYEVVNELKKVKHNHPMLSLQKTHSIDEINDFIGNKDYIIMLKVDGLTCSLGYENGILISAETRGDGEIGEDILHNAYVVKNIPKKIAYKGKLTIDGEIICKTHHFEKFADEYKNPRNFASGSIRLLDSKECEKRNLSFIAWDAVNYYGPGDYRKDTETLSERLVYLNSLGFEITDFTTIGGFSEHNIEFFKDSAKDQGIPIDGLVIKYNNCKYYDSLGRTEHHFRGGMAFKFYDEEYPSYLKYIDWTMGRTGVLTPVAVFEPIEIDGTEVERANIHNLSIMDELFNFKKPYIGQKLYIYKANQIIPQISSVEDTDQENKEFIDILCVCPICGEPTRVKENNDSRFLECGNEACAGKLINRLDHYCGKKGLDIKGLSKATLEKLIDLNWVSNISDLYTLSSYKQEWIAQPGFGKKSVENILNAIEESKTTTLQAFISAIGIPLVGVNVAKKLCAEITSYEDFREKIKSNFDFTQYDGFAEIKSNALFNFDYTEADKIYESYLTLSNPQIVEINNSLSNMTIVITGRLNNYKNRSELQQVIEGHGGKVASAVSSSTSLLINNDNKSKSAKNLAAQKLNIPILTEQEFIETYIDK